MTTTKHYRRAFAGLLLGGLFLMVQTASAQIWSSVGSTCTPDETTRYFQLYNFTNGNFQFAAGKIGSISARCHIMNPKNDGSSPLWNTLTVGGVDPGGTSQVWAQLIAVNKDTGGGAIVANLFSNSVPIPGSVTFAHAWDFINFAYYLYVNVDRTDVNASPALWFVELSKE